ncbi:MAG TPA: DUF1330 domain-containing protein [Acidimicrobiales bacterium]
MAITPTREQFEAFANHEREGEVVMINLLHFAPSNASSPSGGEDAYRDYGKAAVKMVEDRGGRVVWIGRPEHVLIGDSERDHWDLAVLVSYPSRQAFIDMVTTSEYQDAHRDREQGLDRTVLLGCEPVGDWTESNA